MLPSQFKKKRELETRMGALRNQLQQLNAGVLSAETGESSSQNVTAEMDSFYPALTGLDSSENEGGSDTSSLSSSSTQRLNIFEKKIQDLSKKFSDFIGRGNREMTSNIPPSPVEFNRQQSVESSHNPYLQTTTNMVPPTTNLQENTSHNQSQQTTTSPLTQSQSTNIAPTNLERQTQNDAINTQRTNTNTQSSDTHQS